MTRKQGCVKKFRAEHTDVEPFMRTVAEKEELLPLLELLADKMCQTVAFIIGALEHSGLTVVPLNPHAREIAPAQAPTRRPRQKRSRGRKEDDEH